MVRHAACTVARMTCRVLVADDDPELLELVVDSLIDAGAQVVRATTGAELLERLAEEGPFDLVITDISMPWMTGLQVVLSIREVGLEVPVMFITGSGDPSLHDRVRSLGASTLLLRKPFDSAELRAAVTQLVPGSLSPAVPT